jgi:hypothetical protein
MKKRDGRITEPMRQKMAWEMIQESAENASCSTSESLRANALDSIFRIAHTMTSIRCRKNHPGWTKAIDDAIRAKPWRK